MEEKTIRERLEIAKEKGKAFAKNNWKKLVAGAVITGGAVVGIILVKKYSDETLELGIDKLTDLDAPEVPALDPSENWTKGAYDEFMEKGGQAIVDTIHEKVDDLRKICVDNGITVNMDFGAGAKDMTLDDVYHYIEIYKDGKWVYIEQD